MSPDDPSVLPGFKDKHYRSFFEVDKEYRTSNLRAPKERLEDHSGEVLTCDIDPRGELILSAGRDSLIRISRVYNNESPALSMSGHTGPVTQAKFASNGLTFYTSSGDKTVASWDTSTGLRTNRLEGHEEYVNSVHNAKASSMLCSGSDDGTIRIWDTRTKTCCTKLNAYYRVFATCFTESGNSVICAGANNTIDIWNVRRNKIVSELHGHTAPITGIDISPCGTLLLSHSLDGTLRTWHIRAPTRYGRRVNIFPINRDVSHRNLIRCAWSKIGRRVASGCPNHEEVSVWDLRRSQLECKLPVHSDSVNDIVFHPNEPVLLTASSDKYLCLTEINY